MSLPSQRQYHGGAVVNQEIYIVGGRGDRNNHGDGDDLATGLRYDALTGDWYDIAPMMRARIYMGVAGDDSADLLYGVGGHGADGTYLEDAECLDTRTGAWRTLPPLNHPRSGNAAIVMDMCSGPLAATTQTTTTGTTSNGSCPDGQIACRADPDCVESLQIGTLRTVMRLVATVSTGTEWTDVTCRHQRQRN